MSAIFTFEKNFLKVTLVQVQLQAEFHPFYVVLQPVKTSGQRKKNLITEGVSAASSIMLKCALTSFALCKWRQCAIWGFGALFPGYSRSLPRSTVSYIHWRGVPQGPGRGLRPRPGSLRYTPTVNVGKLFSHAPRMAQITAAAAAAVVSFRYFPPGREIPGLNFPARRLPRKYRQIHPGRWPSFCMQIVTWHGRTRESPPG